MVKPGLKRQSTEVSASLEPKQEWKKWDAPFGGIKMIMEDEDRGKPGRVASFFKMLFFAATKRSECC